MLTRVGALSSWSRLYSPSSVPWQQCQSLFFTAPLRPHCVCSGPFLVTPWWKCQMFWSYYSRSKPTGLHTRPALKAKCFLEIARIKSKVRGSEKYYRVQKDKQGECIGDSTLIRAHAGPHLHPPSQFPIWHPSPITPLSIKLS